MWVIRIFKHRCVSSALISYRKEPATHSTEPLIEILRTDFERMGRDKASAIVARRGPSSNKAKKKNSGEKFPRSPPTLE